jgi:hypothetical protein
VGIPFSETVRRAGSLEALLAAAREDGLMARATGGFYTASWNPYRRPGAGDDDRIPGTWWQATAPDKLEPERGRGRFAVGPAVAVSGRKTHVEDLWATGIEFDEHYVNARWPLPPETDKHAGGRPPEYEWEVAAAYVDRKVAAHEPLPRHKKTGKPIIAQARDLMFKGFEDSQKVAPRHGRTVEQWIRDNWQRCRPWWAPKSPA